MGLKTVLAFSLGFVFLAIVPSSFALETVSLDASEVEYARASGVLVTRSYESKDGRFKIGINDSVLEVLLDGKQLVFSQPSVSMGIDIADPKHLEELDVLGREIQLNWTRDLFDFKASLVQIGHSNGPFQLLGADFQCRRESEDSSKSISGDLTVGACATDSSFRLDKVVIPEEVFPKRVSDAQSTMASVLRSLSSSKKYDDFGLDIQGGRFASKLSFRKLIKFTVKMSGTASYDSKSSTLLLNLQKAKLGFLSIRTRVLEALANADLKGVSVDLDTRDILIDLP